VSHATADDLVRLGVCAEEQIVVVPPGIDMRALLAIDRDERTGDDALRTRLGVGAGDLLVGVVGRLAPVKRPALALDVFAALRGTVPGLHVVFVGDGSERRELERRILGADEDTRRRVHLLGAVRDMERVLRALDVVLSCSRSEGLPVALIEAGAAALPVVATDVGGVAEVVVHERTGFLGASADELALWLARLAADANERRATGQRARLRISTRHGAEQLAQRLERVYDAVHAERATPAREGP
jgi:glycosyltransferase involved in cell wall biosynthesis